MERARFTGEQFDAQVAQETRRTEASATNLRAIRRFGEVSKLASARRVLDEAQLASENFSQGIVHVKDGKPLTAHGAKLLGVKWPTTHTKSST